MATRVFEVGNGIKITGDAEFTGAMFHSQSGLTKIITVTVITKTTAHPHHGVGNSDGYALNGVEAPWLTLTQGTYKFDQADSSNSGHPIHFSSGVDGIHGSGTMYTAGVTSSGTPGSAGAYTQIVIGSGGAPVLYYYCHNHVKMGSGLNNAGSESTKTAESSALALAIALG
jgi:hypothetical protein